MHARHVHLRVIGRVHGGNAGGESLIELGKLNAPHEWSLSRSAVLAGKALPGGRDIS